MLAIRLNTAYFVLSTACKRETYICITDKNTTFAAVMRSTFTATKAFCSERAG